MAEAVLAAKRQELALLRRIEERILWLASWTIHNANHLRESRDGLKVGGHQASCASMIASRTSSPRSLSWLANSTIRMPFFAATPIRMIRPISL